MPRLSRDDSESQSIDDALADWRQGDVTLDAEVFVHVGDGARALTDESSEAPEGVSAITSSVDGLVVLTQTCDIVKPCVQQPFIELAPLVRREPKIVHEIACERRPNYAIVPALRDRQLVAHLDRVMTVEKSIVATWSRTPGYTTDEEGRRFAQVLARKRVRFAFPDDFNELAGELKSRITERHARQSDEGRVLRALREVRVQASPSWDAPNVELFFWFVRNELDVSINATEWDKFRERWKALVPPKNRFVKVEGIVSSLEAMTAKDYVDSDPLDLDYLSRRTP